MQAYEVIIKVLGGLALFIYGMQLMSLGLRNVAGEKMRSLLYLFSSNRYVGVISGLIVTAVLQSSSASTVMVIGFVNAGLLNLVQSIGIILGANIGTTVTAQLISFKISWIIMPTIILGLALSFLKRPVLKNWGMALIGFGFLFLGMDTMSAPLRDLSTNEAFVNAFQTFDCSPNGGLMPLKPFLGAIGIGLAVTLILQSSAATIGMVLALGAGGAINSYTGIAITLGANIGTTVTAQLAALTANRLAKQAALAHTLFNVFGVLTVICTIWIRIGGEPLFFALVKYLPGAGTLAREVANADTMFNVCFTIIMLPLVKPFAALCAKIIPMKEESVKYQRLEPHLLDTPALALHQSTATIRRMLKKACRMVDIALRSYDPEEKDALEKVPKLAKREDKIDEYQRDITHYLSELMSRPMTAAQSNVIPKLLHCTNDAERIGDHTAIILNIIERFRGSNGILSSSADEEVKQLTQMLREQAECAVDLLDKPTPEKIKHAATIRNDIRTKTEDFEMNHINRVAEGICQPLSGLFFIEIMSEIRKVSRHVANVTERVDQIMPVVFPKKTAKENKDNS